MEKKNKGIDQILALFRLFLRNKKLGAGVSILFILVLLGSFGPLFVSEKGLRIATFLQDLSPSSKNLLGTDTMGRDIFSMIWYGGRISIFIGLLATIISTFIAIVYGTISGLANDFIDGIMMRITEIFLSIPNLNAQRAESMATFPAPITAILFPILTGVSHSGKR